MVTYVTGINFEKHYVKTKKSLEEKKFIKNVFFKRKKIMAADFFKIQLGL